MILSSFIILSQYLLFIKGYDNTLNSNISNYNNIKSCSYSSTCSVSGISGLCVSKSSGCCTGTLSTGYCPGSSDIQCCTNPTCSTPAGSGTCQQLSACSGTSYSGYCDGPSDIQCCVPGPKPSPACTYSCAQQSATSYKFGTNGLNMLTHFEGFSSTCYKDSVGVWTIGYGHACQDDSDNLPQYGVTCTSGQCSGTLTESQGREVLNTDVERFSSCVSSSVQIPITQNQFDAMVSFAYNNGCSGFQTSTLLSELNAGKLTDQEAQYQFSRWHSGCLTGLERRRFTESQLFSSCATDFGCYYNSCPISYNYPYCSSNCQYCSACGGCSGSSSSLPTCTGG